MSQVTLSGLTPTSSGIHLGNYFGAVRQWIDLQEAGGAHYFIATYHALTTVKKAESLSGNIFGIACDYLALGLDPEKAVIYRQEDVPEVCELSWILSTLTPMGLLERWHAYKDKIEKGISADHGLFAYPVLMAADILIYDADSVPVGRDQKQHVEVTRDLGARGNIAQISLRQMKYALSWKSFARSIQRSYPTRIAARAATVSDAIASSSTRNRDIDYRNDTITYDR